MSFRWLAATVVLALVLGQSIVVPAAPLLDDRPDALDVLADTHGPQAVPAKLEAARPDPRRSSGTRFLLALPARVTTVAAPGQLTVVETRLATNLHDAVGRRTAVARGPPAA